MNAHNLQTALATTNARIGDGAFPENIHRRIFDFLVHGPVVLPPQTNDQRQIIALVCKEWQRVLVSTPKYWNDFDLVQPTTEPSNNLFALAELFFVRSGESIPLAIRFREHLQTEVGRRILELIIRPRMRRVWLLSCTVTTNILRTLFHSVHFPLLQVVDVTITYEMNGMDVLHPHMSVRGSLDLSSFRCAPRLRNIALHIPEGVHPSDLRLPWRQLTHIDLGDTSIDVNKFMQIMERSILLEDGTFRITFASYDDGRAPGLQNIFVPYLQCLRLRLVQPSQDLRFLENLDTPLLGDLWLERDEAGHVIRDMTVYQPFLAGLTSTVKHLTVAQHAIPIDSSVTFIPRVCQHLDDLLRSSEHLTSLFLAPGLFIHPNVLDKIATGALLPLLEQLGVSAVNGWDIISMVQRKNFAPSSSTGGPVSLNYLHLCMMGCRLDDIDMHGIADGVSALHLFYGYVIHYINIDDGSDLD
ncbi:hypothetical protein M413DRAFT_12047 [Hebeloma cylindrosporum]|uniref:F-box domain-containing protein n=1 Tax=Hebeloma cylindrosporum TaxID=76867 RepID=A0A0C2XP21_HEBCY|nr:hypothetical protein M413DRAFT_12047 [Hebeloma cylindrosporum h7]